MDRLADRPTRLLMTVHAEVNAILSAHSRLTGCTLFVAPFFPCANCASAIIQAGIVRVVTWRGVAKEAEARWKEHGEAARTMFAEAGVEITEY
jgi:dCMP deaminase